MRRSSLLAGQNPKLTFLGRLLNGKAPLITVAPNKYLGLDTASNLQCLMKVFGNNQADAVKSASKTTLWKKLMR